LLGNLYSGNHSAILSQFRAYAGLLSKVP